MGFLIAWIVAVPLACGAAAAPVAVGLVNPPGQADAASLLRGVQMAVDEPGPDTGAAATLAVRGSAGQWGTPGNDAVSLVSEAHVGALIAPPDGVSCHLILQVSGRMRIPVATLCQDASVTETGVPWALRVVPETGAQALALAGPQGPGPGAPDWWAIVPSDGSGRSIRRDLATASRARAVPISNVAEWRPSPGARPAPVQALLAASPGGVLVWLPARQAGAAAAALRAAGYRGLLAGPCTCDSPDFVDAAAEAAEGFRIARFQDDARSRARASLFEEHFIQRFGTRPDFTAASAHDAAQVLIENLACPGDTSGYRRFPPVRSTAGVTGTLSFDASGNRTGPLQVLAFRKSRFIPLPP